MSATQMCVPFKFIFQIFFKKVIGKIENFVIKSESKLMANLPKLNNQNNKTDFQSSRLIPNDSYRLQICFLF